MSGFGSTSFVRFGVGGDRCRFGSGGRPGAVCGQTWAGTMRSGFLVRFFVRLQDRFFVPTCPGPVTPRAAAVKDGRRCGRAAGSGAARPRLDGGEHGVTLAGVGTAAISVPWAL